MVIDKSDVPHIAFISGNALTYGLLTDGQWFLDTISEDNSINWYYGTSIAVTESGNVHIIYTKNYMVPGSPIEYGSVWWATNSSGIWQTTEICPGSGGKIILDSLNKPQVVSIANDGGLQLSGFDGDQWTTQDVLPALGLKGSVQYPDITFDSEGNINLFFIYFPDTSTANGIPVHALFDGEFWVKDFFDSSTKPHFDLSAARSGSTINVLYAEWFNHDTLRVRWAHASDIKLVTIQSTTNGSNLREFTVIRTGNLDKPLRVYYYLSEIDYNWLDYFNYHFVVIPAGLVSTNIKIYHPLGRGSNSIKIVLLPNPAYRLTKPSSATLLIK